MQGYGKLGRVVEVGIACFVGGTVGALIALRINGNFWWLGMIAGGLVGYLLYDLPQVITAIKVAAKTAVTIWPEEVARAVGRLWTAVRKESSLVGATGGLGFVAVFLGFGLGLMAWTSGLKAAVEKFVTTPGELAIWSGLALVGAVLGAYVGSEQNWRWQQLNPIRQTPNLFLLLLEVLWSCLVPLLLFLLCFLRLIHSDLRMIVGLDSAIGAWVGYLLGNPLIGGLVGAVLGVVSYLVVQRLSLLVTKNAENAA